MYRWLAWFLLGLIGGCASESRRESPCSCTTTTPASPPADPGAPSAQVRVERGRPNRLLDGAGRMLGAPDQLLLWNRRVNNHQISPKTEQIVLQYLSDHNMPDVL